LDLNTHLNVEFSALSIGGVKNIGFLSFEKKVDLEMTLKERSKVKSEVTIKFLVESY